MLSVNCKEFERPLELSENNRIQPLIRAALAFGYLSTTTEAQINRIITQGGLSTYDWVLLETLLDALQQGWVQRVSSNCNSKPLD